MFGMSQSVFYVIVVIVWIVCAAASAGIALIKHRDPVTYGAIGFFFGVIGLLVASVVPSLKVKDLSCKYLNAGSNPSVDRGRLQPIGTGIRFTSGDQGYAFDIPFVSIQGVQKYTKKNAPRDLPLRSKMLAENMMVLALQYSAQGQQVTSYFSVYKTVLPLFIAEVITPGMQSGTPIAYPQQVTIPQPGNRISHDILVNGQVAFRRGEAVAIESVNPDPGRPEYKYVVTSITLNQKFRLSDQDILTG